MPTSPDSVTYTSTTNTVLGMPTEGVNLTAAGTTQADAVPILDDVAIFTTVPFGTGARLIDKDAVVINRGAQTLTVYPQLNAQIEAYGTNVGVSVVAGGSATFNRVSLVLYRVR